jgi:hypothetical protein
LGYGRRGATQEGVLNVLYTQCILQQVTSIVNYIKPHPLRTHLLAKYGRYVEIWDQSMTMFYFIPKFGGYRGGVLKRFFTLREELG